MRSHYAELVSFFKDCTDEKKAAHAAEMLDSAMLKMLEEKKFDFRIMEQFAKVFDEIIMPHFINQVMQKLPGIEAATTKFLAEQKITGGTVNSIVKNCLDKLTVDLSKMNPPFNMSPLMMMFRENLISQLKPHFASIANKPYFPIMTLAAIVELDDELFFPMKNEYDKSREKFFNIFNTEIEELEKMTPKQSEGYEILYKDLLSRLKSRIAKEKTQYDICYNQLADKREKRLLTYDEFNTELKKLDNGLEQAVTPILEQVFHHWREDKTEEIRELFLGKKEEMFGGVIIDIRSDAVFSREKAMQDAKKEQKQKTPEEIDEKTSYAANQEILFSKTLKKPFSSLLHKTKNFAEAKRILAASNKNWMLHRSANTGVLALTCVDLYSESGYKTIEFNLNYSVQGDRLVKSWFDISRPPADASPIATVDKIEYGDLKTLLLNFMRENSESSLTLDNFCIPTPAEAGKLLCLSPEFGVKPSLKIWDQLKDDLQKEFGPDIPKHQSGFASPWD